MRVASLFAFSTLALATPALAQTAADPENVKAEDVALSPLSDINLRKKDVPPVLEAAVANPYDMSGIKSCAGFTTAISDLDVALGDDIDVARGKSDEEKMGNGAGSIAKSVIGSFIPFRGVIRELSGANAQQRQWDRAIYAGSVRRAFLKGVGESKGCAYPARSATPEMAAWVHSQRDAAKLAKRAKVKTAGAPVQVAYDSTAVVQPVSTSRR